MNAQLRIAVVDHQFHAQGAAAHLGVDVIDDGIEQATHGRAGGIDTGEVGRDRVVQLEDIADLVGRAGEDLVHAEVDRGQFCIERRDITKLVAQLIHLGQEIQEQLLEVEIEELRQQLARGTARLRGYHDTERIGNIRPGENQPGIDQGERRRAAGKQRRHREVPRELQVVGRRIALQVDGEEIKRGKRRQLIGANQTVKFAGDGVASGFLQIKG